MIEPKSQVQVQIQVQDQMQVQERKEPLGGPNDIHGNYLGPYS